MSSLVYRYITLVGTIVIGSSENVSFEITQRRVDEIIYIAVIIEDIWCVMKTHVVELNDGVSKYHSLRNSLLPKGDSSSSTYNNNPSPRLSPAVQHMLRTAIMAR